MTNLKAIIKHLTGNVDKVRLVLALLLVASGWLVSNQIIRESLMITGFLVSSYPALIRYKYVVYVIGYGLGFIKTLKPVEYINLKCESHYGLAVLRNETWTLDTYSTRFKLDSDGIIREGTNLYLFWLPLRHDERIQHILSSDLPDFENISKLNDDDKMDSIIDEFNKRK